MAGGIVIVDYRMGNPGSIRSMLRYIGVDSVISRDADVLAQAGKIIFAGVGAFDTAMRNLEELGLLPVLNQRALEDRIPVLGICLGMQLLTERSEEGCLPGLGWVPGETVRFRFDPQATGLKIPHMGWNVITPEKESPLLRDLPDERRFYFVHSYHVECRDPADVLATASHGYRFCAAVERGNIVGTQFHPEKSHRFGIQLLRNFAEAN